MQSALLISVYSFERSVLCNLHYSSRCIVLNVIYGLGLGLELSRVFTIYVHVLLYDEAYVLVLN